MKRLPLSLTICLLVAGCAAGTPFGPAGLAAPDHPGTNYFAYRIDPVIAGRYGTTGEVATVTPMRSYANAEPREVDCEVTVVAHE